MSPSVPASARWSALLAAGLFAALLLLDGRVDLNLNDEGFLWYGTLLTSQGEVPLRDFQSYDPGRYYWGAAWFRLSGASGVVVLRCAAIAFACLAIFLALRLLATVLAGAGLLSLAALAFGLWLWAPYKAYEFAFSLLAVVVGAGLADSTALRRHIAAGAFVGVAAWFGRNHALYAVAAFTLVILATHAPHQPERLARRGGALLAGVLIGSVPLLLQCLLAPGFLDASLGMLSSHVNARVVNLPRAVPWPWSLPWNYYRVMPALRVAQELGLRLHFVLMPPVAIALFWLAMRRRDLRHRGVLLAASSVGIVYLHYAFSRPDLGHLASSVPPLLVALMVLPFVSDGFRRRLSPLPWMASLVAIAALTAGTQHAGPRKAMGRRGEWVRRDVAGDTLWLGRSTWVLLRRIGDRCAEAPGETPLFASPIFPGLYPALGLRAPVWNLIFQFPETAVKQERIAAQLRRQGVAVAVVCDGQPRDWPFSETHPLLWYHFQTEWDFVEALPDGCQMRRPRPSGAISAGRTPAAPPSSTASRTGRFPRSAGGIP